MFSLIYQPFKTIYSLKKFLYTIIHLFRILELKCIVLNRLDTFRNNKSNLEMQLTKFRKNR